MWIKEIKGRKLKPEDFNFISFVFISIGLLSEIGVVCAIPEIDVVFISIPLMLLAIGILVLFMKKGYREKYFPDRRFSEPVSPDGSPLEDNSAELKKQISEEIKDVQNRKLNKYKTAATVMLSYTISSAVLKIILGSDVTEKTMLVLATPTFFIGLSVFVTIWIYRENMGNMKLKLFLAIAYLVTVLVVTSFAVLYFMGNDTASYLVIALTVIASGFIVHKVIVLSIIEYDEQETP